MKWAMYPVCQVCTEYWNFNWNKVHISFIFDHKFISLNNNRKLPQHWCFDFCHWSYHKDRNTYFLWRVQKTKEESYRQYTTNKWRHFPLVIENSFYWMQLMLAREDGHLSIFYKFWRYATSFKKNRYAEKMFRHCFNNASICLCIISNKTSIRAYYNHIKLFTQHFIPKMLFVVKSVTDIMKHHFKSD